MYPRGISPGGGLGEGFSAAVFEAPAGVAGLDDVAVMGQAIEHGGGHLGVAEHLRPIGEGEVGGNQQRCVFVELADQMEQQLSAGLTERQIAEFVDDDEIVAQQFFGQPAALAGSLLLLELVDQIDKVEEPPPGAAADDGAGDGNAEMSFAGAGWDSVILPGVRRLRSGSPTRFTRGAARRSQWSVRSVMLALNTSSFGNPIGRWRCCRRG